VTTHEQYPQVAVAYELRLTGRALDDIGVRGDVGPGDLDAIEAAAPERDIVRKFRSQRAQVPTGTEGPMRRMGRGDVFSLHGRTGQRACTWFDPGDGVCWLLGVVAEHDYEELERRAAASDLLPSVEDLTILELERGDFESVVTPGLRALVADALTAPGTAVRGTVGGLLRLEVAVLVVAVDHAGLADVFISVRTPPLVGGAPAPRGWPGGALVQRLAELATNTDYCDLRCDHPSQMPAGEGSWRRIDPSREMAIVVHDVEIPASSS